MLNFFIISFFKTGLQFASGLNSDFQLVNRSTLHLDPWVTDLSAYLPRILRHTKGSRYHPLTDSESSSLPLHSLQVSVWQLTKQGCARAQRARNQCARHLALLSGTEIPGMLHISSPWHTASARRQFEHNLGIKLIFLKGSWYFGLTKIEKHFRKKIGFVCKWRIFLKRNSCYETEIWRPRWC